MKLSRDPATLRAVYHKTKLGLSASQVAASLARDGFALTEEKVRWIWRSNGGRNAFVRSHENALAARIRAARLIEQRRSLP
jgi:hypothetical protein